MRFFVAAAIRGGRTHQPEYRAIVAFLEHHGTVVNPHVADDTISEYGETDLTKEQIHDRELQSLRSSDLVIAEVTTPSLGVGYLIAAAVHAQKPVVCLYQGTETYKLYRDGQGRCASDGAYVRGNR